MRAMLSGVRILTALLLINATFFLASGCQSGGGSINGNDGGSTPINDAESIEYKKALVRCYKTGGTRVVKIMGDLRCY